MSERRSGVRPGGMRGAGPGGIERRRVRRLLPAAWAQPSLLAGGGILVLLAGAALCAGLLFPDDPMDMAGPPLEWPGTDADFPLGTDSMGRDIASGLLHGARISLAVGLLSSTFALLLGTAVGAVAGFYRGRTDDALMRTTELVQMIPQFMLVIVLLVIFRPTVPVVTAAIAVVSWPPVARLVRGEVMGLREREFVQSCRTIGMSDARIIVTQILPNALPVLVVSGTILLSSSILMEASLSFLGLGDPNVLSWGSMIGAGQDQLRAAWYVVALPGAALLLTALGLNLFGEGLTGILGSRNRRR